MHSDEQVDSNNFIKFIPQLATCNIYNYCKIDGCLIFELGYFIFQLMSEQAIAMVWKCLPECVRTK